MDLRNGHAGAVVPLLLFSRSATAPAEFQLFFSEGCCESDPSKAESYCYLFAHQTMEHIVKTIPKRVRSLSVN